jgi:hypothetical protein
VAPAAIRWTTVDPAVDAEHHWVRVEQPLRYGRPVRIAGRRDDDAGSVALTTDNARLLRVSAAPGARLRRVAIDGDVFAGRGVAQAWLRHDGERWDTVDGLPPGEKSARRSGPFKLAFGNRFVLVVGTAGTAAESRELLERARHDAGLWRYRANGLAEVVRDVDFAFAAPHRFAGRNVIVYGNADSNQAWDLVFDDDCPLRARRGALTAGDQTWERDDLAAIFVHRRRGDGTALAAAFADTGPVGSRLHALLLTFVSGVGYPDYAVFTPDVCESGDRGVLAAGWFTPAWGWDGDDRPGSPRVFPEAE